MLGLVGPVSEYCDPVRWKVWSATSISVWQHVKLSEQIRPWDTLACCWDVKHPTNKQTNFNRSWQPVFRCKTGFMKLFSEVWLNIIVWWTIPFMVLLCINCGKHIKCNLFSCLLDLIFDTRRPSSEHYISMGMSDTWEYHSPWQLSHVICILIEVLEIRPLYDLTFGNANIFLNLWKLRQNNSTYTQMLLLTSMSNEDLQYIVHGLTLGLFMCGGGGWGCWGCGSGATAGQTRSTTQNQGALLTQTHVQLLLVMW